ncbi:hypothetical protein [Paenibacillus arenosi]|uniref:Uncharacterized protein n=1 Tax=Paenibacillus arenosi TaxID=2774142 RepID=A0ABR9ASB0_9BACL|nr:hypothetical protein [Paenibacillus arenosi]MBD8497004.1 hypothetical protein [Paenibacillus arenosi]
MDVIEIGMLVIVGSVISLLFFRIIFRMICVRSEHRDGQYILTSYLSNFYGVSSKGMKQVRGNGLLYLARTAICYEMYVPKKRLEIPLNKIVHIGTTNRHLGKIGCKLLKVTFKTEQGEETAAWSVNDAEHWIQEINMLRQQLSSK